ncbi:hypothetical protein DPMN_162894 [Dreissena polymorpha]|uniref:A disintegrin and metalloproteinase with thrombospondin motifs 18 n=1 Tax=Dreissena polymorpha TaxID=45954 RepID=A0A9D4ESJ5_DREPO|nr:hypothetical protein DPMN_162894 [Dreissena polymorpha]
MKLHILSGVGSRSRSYFKVKTGVLMFPHDDYVIEPLPSHLSNLQQHRHHQQHHHKEQQQHEHNHQNKRHNENHFKSSVKRRNQHGSHLDQTSRDNVFDNHDNLPHNHDNQLEGHSGNQDASSAIERHTHVYTTKDPELGHRRKQQLSKHSSHSDNIYNNTDLANHKSINVKVKGHRLNHHSSNNIKSVYDKPSFYSKDIDYVQNDTVSNTSAKFSDLDFQGDGVMKGQSNNSGNVSEDAVTGGVNIIGNFMHSDDSMEGCLSKSLKSSESSKLHPQLVESTAHRHILYKRSALPQHRQGNYETSKDFNNHAAFSDQSRSSRRRKKRSYESVERSVETLVVVDQDMYRKHGRENVTTYVLSIFNIVSQLYQDTTLGYPINIILVGLVFLDGREPGLYISNHADKTLNSFCQWQAGVHNGRRKLHDHAVLLTGKDICSYQNAPCDTLGFAPIDGMCSEIRSCIVNEDTGLSTAFTVAHEMGHNFGMMHDGDGNDCKDTAGFIMSPTLAAQSGTFHWSPCSRQYMRKFLNAVQSECLTSQTRGTAELKFPNKLPGEIFDADTQCKWQFGSHSKKCTIMFGKDPCMNLFCHKREGMCETKFLPAAEGTSCGPGLWCKQARCVSYGKKGPTPVDGWWTEWGSWSQCTRSCGGGIKSRTRECNNPRPQYGGNTCTGPEVIHKMCNLVDCESSQGDFRELQCKQLAQENFRGWNYRWRSYREGSHIEAEDECKLYCKADGYNFYYTMPREVTDGTRCNDYSTDVCVQGKCQKVGCDLIVGSTARKDRCGVCDGDNSTCKIVENVFTQQPTEKAYYGVVYLPRGSSSISIEEMGISRSNYLALRNVQGHYFLNGNWKLNSEGVYSISGTKFVYRRPYNSPESLSAEGPILEDLVVEVLIQSENPGVKYSFTVPKYSNYLPPVQHNYTWSVVLTECSQPCAGGEQTVTAHCHRDAGEEVDPAYCDPQKKPGTGQYSCNTQACDPRWIAEPWSVCHRSCGGGKQKRRIYCMQRLSVSEDRRLPRKFCAQADKPPRKRECNTHECPPVWYTGHWSECSKTCDKGLKSRSVVCRRKTQDGYVVQPDSMCSGQSRPVQHKGCREKRCPDPNVEWTTTPWSQCSSTCGTGSLMRDRKCMKKTKSGEMIVTLDKKCRHLPDLNVTLTQQCDLEPCPEKPEWYASPWSRCSVTCGNGTQTRLVHCIHQQYRRLAKNCDETVKPDSLQECLLHPCINPGPVCTDEFSWCHLVPKHNICDHKFYGTKCCLSCTHR